MDILIKKVNIFGNRQNNYNKFIKQSECVLKNYVSGIIVKTGIQACRNYVNQGFTHPVGSLRQGLS